MTGSDQGASTLAIRPYEAGDRSALLALWRVSDLIRPWNDPAADIERWLGAENATILVGLLERELVAAIVVGHDGHRGWLYYLAVKPALRKRGHGRALVAAAEDWLKARGLPKAQLMVRGENRAVAEFYQRLGYAPENRAILSHWLTPDGQRPGATPEDGKLEITITSLEMTARPSQPVPPAPGRSKIAILRAEQPPPAFYRYLYNEVGKEWLWYERRKFDDAALVDIIHHPKVEIFVLYVDGVPAGYAELDRRREPEIELAYFGLLPDFIGRGLGTFFLMSAIDIAWSYGPKRLWVHTCTLDHPRALGLYQRCGFVPYRQDTKTIDDPREFGAVPA